MPRVDRVPRRRLGVDDRKREILAAAGRAFIDAPYDRVQLAAIARAAGASEALVVKYFGSKAGLYVELLRRAVDELERRSLAAVEATRDASPEVRLDAVLAVYLDLVLEWGVGWRSALSRVSAEPVEAEPVRADYRRRSADAYAAAFGLDPARAALPLYGYLGFVDFACAAWATRGYRDDDRELLIGSARGVLLAAVEPLRTGPAPLAEP